jgi:hypothetical protein
VGARDREELVRQGRLEQRGIVRIERDAHTGLEQSPERMLGERRIDAEPHVAGRTHVARDSLRGEVREQAGIVDGTDTVRDAIAAERADRAPDTLRALGLARVRIDAETVRLRVPEQVREQLGRVVALASTEPEGHDALVPVRDRPLHGCFDGAVVAGPPIAGHVDDEAHLEVEVTLRRARPPPRIPAHTSSCVMPL